MCRKFRLEYVIIADISVSTQKIENLNQCDTIPLLIKIHTYFDMFFFGKLGRKRDWGRGGGVLLILKGFLVFCGFYVSFELILIWS